MTLNAVTRTTRDGTSEMVKCHAEFTVCRNERHLCRLIVASGRSTGAIGARFGDIQWPTCADSRPASRRLARFEHEPPTRRIDWNAVREILPPRRQHPLARISHVLLITRRLPVLDDCIGKRVGRTGGWQRAGVDCNEHL